MSQEPAKPSCRQQTSYSWRNQEVKKEDKNGTNKRVCVSMRRLSDSLRGDTRYPCILSSRKARESLYN